LRKANTASRSTPCTETTSPAEPHAVITILT
jgi:hypothetical protein